MSNANKNFQKKKIVTVFIVFLCVLVVYGFKFFKKNPFFPQTSASARSKGNPQAANKIIEFMDFQCPACAKGAEILRTLLKDHPKEYYLEVKYFPLEMHMHSIRAARYAECAARQGKFWEVHDLFFSKQPDWRELINAEPAFSQMLKTAQIDPPKLEKCLADPKVNDAISKDKEEGKTLGIQSTPTYFVNGKMVVGTTNLEKELNISKPLLTQQGQK